MYLGFPIFSSPIFRARFIPIYLSLIHFFYSSSPSHYTLPAFHRFVLGARFGKSAKERSPKRDVSVLLFISVDDNPTGVGTSTVCWRAHDVASALQRQMHSYSLVDDNGRDLLAIGTAVIVEQRISNAYLCSVPTTDLMLTTLANVCCTGVYAWESQVLTLVAHKQPTLPPSWRPAS